MLGHFVHFAALFGCMSTVAVVVLFIYIWLRNERKYEYEARLMAAEFVCQQVLEMQGAYTTDQFNAAQARMYAGVQQWQKAEYL